MQGGLAIWIHDKGAEGKPTISLTLGMSPDRTLFGVTLPFGGNQEMVVCLEDTLVLVFRRKPKRKTQLHFGGSPKMTPPLFGGLCFRRKPLVGRFRPACASGRACTSAQGALRKNRAANLEQRAKPCRRFQQSDVLYVVCLLLLCFSSICIGIVLFRVF